MVVELGKRRGAPLRGAGWARLRAARQRRRAGRGALRAESRWSMRRSRARSSSAARFRSSRCSAAPGFRIRYGDGDRGERRCLSSGDVERWLEQRRIFSARLLATNHDGLVLGKYVAAEKLASSLASGFAFADTCFGVDPGGEVALGWDWGGWRGEVTDIKLVPDPATLVEDPELPGLASVICDFTDVDGRRLPACYRGLLRALVERLAERGYSGLGRARGRVHGLRRADRDRPRAGLSRADAARRPDAGHVPDVALARDHRRSWTRSCAASRRLGIALGVVEQRDRPRAGRDQPGPGRTARDRRRRHPHEAGPA